MRSSLRLAAVLLAALAWGSGQAGADSAFLVDRVSQDSYQNYLDNQLYTHTGDNRGNGAQHDLARTAIFGELSGLGLTTSLDSFSYSGHTYYNVVAEKPGAWQPNNVFIIGAHFDSANNPGANDNASGVAGVLEAARILSQYEFSATLRFIAFDREEQGLIGSTAYAAAHAGENIVGMISLDMLAYNPAGGHHDKAYIYGRTASDPLKQDLAQAMLTYGDGLTPDIGGDVPSSDHAPFEARGFEAAVLVEHAVWSDPYYHGAADSVDTAGYLDYWYATRMTRSAVGYLADAAELTPEPGTGALVLLSLTVLATWRRRRGGRR